MNDLVSEPLLDKREFVRQIIAPATWGKRLANFLIDFVVSTILAAGVMLVFSLTWSVLVDDGIFRQMENMNTLIDRVLTFVVRAMVYYIPFEYFTGRTIGKMLTRTKVVTRDGEKADLGAIVLRNCARIIPFDCLSFFSENPVGWHDQAGGTMIVDDIPLYNLEENKTAGFYGEEENW